MRDIQLEKLKLVMISPLPDETASVRQFFESLLFRGNGDRVLDTEIALLWELCEETDLTTDDLANSWRSVRTALCD